MNMFKATRGGFGAIFSSRVFQKKIRIKFFGIADKSRGRIQSELKF